MCATFQFRGKTYKPGQEVTGSGEHGIVRHAWAGFARSEILSWWQKRGAVLIDIPADRFAERSEVTGKLVWDTVTDGFVIRGLVDIQTIQPLIKVVTRASSPEELDRFQHLRMPLLEVPGLQHCRRVWRKMTIPVCSGEEQIYCRASPGA